MAEATLLDAVLRANGARCGGDSAAQADLPPGAHPFVISCMDPRLVGILIPALGLERDAPPQAKFAGGVVRPGDQAGVRSVLAAAVFNTATEVLVVGHTDCRMGKTSAMEVRSGLARLGVTAEAFGGEDPVAWLGGFPSEHQSVVASVAALRADPRIPPAMPVHGLLFNIESGRLEVVVRGYEAAGARVPAAGPAQRTGPVPLSAPMSQVYGAPAGPGVAGRPLPPAFAPDAGMAAPGPVSFGSGPGSARGPVAFGALPPIGSGASAPLFHSTLSGGNAPPLYVNPGSASPGPAPPGPFAPPPPPPPPPAPAAAAPSASPPSSFPEPRPMAEAAPPPPPEPAPPPPELHGQPRRQGRKKHRGDSPFDRAQETLERLRRDRDGDR